MACTPFTVDFTGSADNLFSNMKKTASDNGYTLIIDTTAQTMSVKKIITLAKGDYQINGQKITITVTQNPPGYSCQKTQDAITSFINGGNSISLE